MELLSHLGLQSGPEHTIRSLAYRSWAVFVCFLLLRWLFWYHILSAALSVLAYVAPHWADKCKSFGTRVFWRLTALFVRLNKISISVTGDQIGSGSALLMCNHQSIIDYFLMVHLARDANYNLQPQVNFFTWYSLWRIPTLRTLLNVALCDENWELSRQLCRSTFRKVVTSEAPQWVVLFPEVNIWTPAAAYSQRLQAKHYFLPYYDHTLYPRYSGLLNAVNTLGNRANIKFSRAYNVTIVFQGRPPTLLQMFASPEKISVTVDVKAMALKSIPQRKPKLEKWLEKTWLEKDRKIGAMKAANAAEETAGSKAGTVANPEETAKKPSASFLDIPIATLVKPLTRLASRG